MGFNEAQHRRACKKTASKPRGAARLWGASPTAPPACPPMHQAGTSPQQGLCKICCLVLLRCLFCKLQARLCCKPNVAWTPRHPPTEPCSTASTLGAFLHQ